jgi:mono/diheme cytochrome c family protein
MVPRMNLPNAVRAFRVRPIAALAAILAVSTMGNALLVGCGGNKSADTTTTSETPAAETPPADNATAGGAAGEVSLAAGQKVYTERCVLCHGASGKGDGAGAAGLDPKPRDHTDGTYMNARTDDELLAVIRTGKGNMPAWGTILSDAEQHAVLLYVRSLAVPPYPGAAH